MVFLTRDQVNVLELEEARAEALKYSNLCRANVAVINVLENLVAKLTEELGAQNQIVLDAQAKLDNLKHRIFGRSSEKRTGNEGLPLLDSAQKEPEKRTITYEREKKKREQFGRTEQPALPRTSILHELPEEEVKAQGLTKWEGQFETSELITVVPTKFVVEEHQRQKYFAVNPEDPEGRTVVTAPGPLKLKDGSRYSIEFGVDVGISKYQFHLPLDRQVRMAGQVGLEVSSQVLYAQIDTIGWYLGNQVIPGIRDQIHQSRMNIADETYWENLGKDAQRRFCLWGVRNEKAVLFNVFDSRSKKVAQEFLGELKGVLLTDGYQVYPALSSADLTLANDWAHCRRKFVAAEKTHPAESREFVDLIRGLFAVEERIAQLPDPERLLIRQRESKPLTDTIEKRCLDLKNVLPQSPLARAVHYTLNLWSGLTRFLSNPAIPLDSNSIERTLRSPVVGRKNHYGSKTLESARMAAIWYSVIATCEANRVDPRAYIDDTLRRILTRQAVPMPWDWKPPVATAPPASPP